MLLEKLTTFFFSCLGVVNVYNSFSSNLASKDAYIIELNILQQVMNREE